MKIMDALIFDCDGVLVDTERDGHRVAFNRAFSEAGIDVAWDVNTYGELLKVAGGKERMKFFFDQHGWPEIAEDHDAFIRNLHQQKTQLFMNIIESGELTLRHGIARIVDEAIAKGIKLAVCSTSNERAVNLIVDKLLGPERKSHFSAILAGDVVSRKKPDPEIYNLAIRTMSLDPLKCVVIEDSRNGFLASRSAGLPCLITTNGYTEDEDFTGADLVISSLGDPPGEIVTIEDIMHLTK